MTVFNRIGCDAGPQQNGFGNRSEIETKPKSELWGVFAKFVSYFSQTSNYTRDYTNISESPNLSQSKIHDESREGFSLYRLFAKCFGFSTHNSNPSWSGSTKAAAEKVTTKYQSIKDKLSNLKKAVEEDWFPNMSVLKDLEAISEGAVTRNDLKDCQSQIEDIIASSKKRYFPINIKSLISAEQYLQTVSERFDRVKKEVESYTNIEQLVTKWKGLPLESKLFRAGKFPAELIQVIKSVVEGSEYADRLSYSSLLVNGVCESIDAKSLSEGIDQLIKEYDDCQRFVRVKQEVESYKDIKELIKGWSKLSPDSILYRAKNFSEKLSQIVEKDIEKSQDFGEFYGILSLYDKMRGSTGDEIPSNFSKFFTLFTSGKSFNVSTDEKFYKSLNTLCNIYVMSDTDLSFDAFFGMIMINDSQTSFLSLIENYNQNINLSTSTELGVNAKWMIENKTQLATRKPKVKKVTFDLGVTETPFDKDGIDLDNQKQKTLKTSNLFSEVLHHKAKS